MRASEFEFRARFWIIAGLFFLGALVPGRFPVLAILGYRFGAIAAAAITLFFFAAAAGLRTWAAAYLNPEIIHSKQVHADRLVADGPFRHVRNPLYLGSIFLAVAFGTFFAPAGFLIVVAGMYLFGLRLIGREEWQLAAAQGESYREYLAQVPRLVPALRPRVAAGQLDPDWTKAFRGELMFWLFFLDALVFFVDGRYFDTAGRVNLLKIGIFIAIAVHILVQPRARARTA